MRSALTLPTLAISQSNFNRLTCSKPQTSTIGLLFLLVIGFFAGTFHAAAQTAGTYVLTNLVSDGFVPAATINANFINPWAISSSGTWWISAAGMGYNFVIPGNIAVPATFGMVNFKVIVPLASNATTPGHPAGSVTTGGASGMILPNGTKANFLFSTLDGTISGWNNLLGQEGAIAQVVINNSSAGASYPGLAIYNPSATVSYIFAPNFGTGRTIEVYNNTFARATLAGSFTDPNLPSNYAPFSVHVIGTKVYVAYAVRTAAAPYLAVAGAGNGIVDVFDVNGNFITRAITGGNLNAPWGVAIAPASFGIFGGSLLIGNFGDGHINAYDPTTYAYRGQLDLGTGAPITYASLWELLPGGTSVSNTTAVSGGDLNSVYFTAGLANEAHGLFAAISNSATPTGSANFGFSAGAGAVTVTDGSTVQVPISVAPTNGFSGTVTLACTGLPIATTCSFSPAQITASASAVGSSTLTIQTTKSVPHLQTDLRGTHTGITVALLLPFASVLLFYRRRSPIHTNPPRLLSLIAVTLIIFGTVTACSSNSGTLAPSTPTGTAQITVTATSGTITQSTVIAMTVQ